MLIVSVRRILRQLVLPARLSYPLGVSTLSLRVLELAARLASSDVLSSVPGIQVYEASDHLAVYADFKAT